MVGLEPKQLPYGTGFGQVCWCSNPNSCCAARLTALFPQAYTTVTGRKVSTAQPLTDSWPGDLQGIRKCPVQDFLRGGLAPGSACKTDERDVSAHRCSYIDRERRCERIRRGRGVRNCHRQGCAVVAHLYLKNGPTVQIHTTPEGRRG